MTLIAALAVTLAGLDAPAIDPALSPEVLLPRIIADLKRTLADPYSIRDMTLCAPQKVRMKNGRPHSWAVMFGLNARGPSGGYSGFAPYVIAFREDRVTVHAMAVSMPTDGGLDKLINDGLLRKVAACPAVPDAVVQGLLAAPIGTRP